VWLHATVDYDAVLTLRRCLDDDHMPAAAAAAAALSSLAGGADSGAGGVGAALRATAGSGPGGAGVGANGGANAIGSGVAVIDYIALANGATWWLDCVECAPPSRVAATGATAPVWRGGEPPEATFVPTTWTAATGPIVLRDDGTVPPDPADEEDQAEELGTGHAERSLSPEEKQEKRRARAMTRAADPIASLLRAGILPRLRWMLEVGKHPASVAPALALCAAAARHSAGGATAVARCPRMLDVLLTLAGGTGAAGVSTSYPPRGSAAAALRVIRLVAASASEHARRIGAEGVPAAAVRAAVSTGTPETSREAAGVWIETLRLWSATTAAGGATPSVDGLYPLIAPMLELPTATRGPEHASTAAGVAAEVFALLAAVVDAGGLSKPKRSVPENAETDAEAPHPSATLSMTEASSATMSWACAAGAAKAAEAWATATNPGARAAPAFAAGAPGAERSHSAWRAAGAAAHFLASLLTAVTRGSDAQASAAAVGAARRTLGLDEEEPAVSVRRLSGTESVRRLSATVAPVEEPAPPATNAPVLEPEEGLAAAALDALGSGSNDGTDGAFAARAAYGTALYGALRLVAATPGAASSPGALRLASRAVRQLTVSAAVYAAAIAAAIEDGAIRAGRAPLVAAAELPGQLALVVALELQDAADAAERRAASANAENDLAENVDDVDGAVAAVEAVAALARALPPGAGRTALDALSAGHVLASCARPSARGRRHRAGRRRGENRGVRVGSAGFRRRRRRAPRARSRRRRRVVRLRGARASALEGVSRRRTSLRGRSTYRNRRASFAVAAVAGSRARIPARGLRGGTPVARRDGEGVKGGDKKRFGTESKKRAAARRRRVGDSPAAAPVLASRAVLSQEQRRGLGRGGRRGRARDASGAGVQRLAGHEGPPRGRKARVRVRYVLPRARRLDARRRRRRRGDAH
jgi:hypothetical protein